MAFVPVDINAIKLDKPSSQVRPEQSFVGGMKLGAKKRALGIAELGLNAASALGADVAGAKELVGDLGQRYAREGTGTGVKGGVAEILGDPLTFLPGATLPKILGQGALMGATAPTGDTNSDLASNAINAAGGVASSGLGYGGGKVISKIAKPIGNQLTEVGKAGIRKLEEAGVPLTAAQKTGSKALAALEATFSNLPMTSGAQNRVFEKQREAFTKAALKEAGINANTASRNVIESAAKKFGMEYDFLASGNKLNIDEPLLQGVAKAYDDATNGVLGVDASSLVKKVAKDIFDAKGAIDGKVYQKTRSMLTQASQTAKTHEATVLKQLRNELDAAFERSLPETQRGMMANINKRYQAFKPIQKAMESSKAEGLKTGNIDPTALYNQVEVGAPLSNLSDAAAGFLRPTIPDSGTAQRLFMQNALTGGGVGGATYLATQDPESAAAAAAFALGGPRAVQMIVNSGKGQKYLAEGMRPAIQAGANAVSRALPPAISSGVSLNKANTPTQTQAEPMRGFVPVDINNIQLDAPATTMIEPLSYNSEQPSLMGKIKQAESAGNPNAKNPLSSASGLYQFTDGTWRDSVAKWGGKYGISAADKNNPQAQEAMMRELTNDNARILQNKGIEPSDGNLYFAHFMGANAAAKAIEQLGTGKQAAMLFPKEASANPSIFFAGSRPRTIEEVYQIITNKVA